MGLGQLLITSVIFILTLYCGIKILISGGWKNLKPIDENLFVILIWVYLTIFIVLIITYWDYEVL